MNAPAAIDAFLAELPAAQRDALNDLRRKIGAAAPDAVEVIAYGVPGYRIDGRYLLGFGASKKHCSFYCGSVLNAFPMDLSGFDTRKGTIHFTPETLLPAALVTKIVKARAAAVRQRSPRLRRSGRKLSGSDD